MRQQGIRITGIFAFLTLAWLTAYTLPGYAPPWLYVIGWSTVGTLWLLWVVWLIGVGYVLRRYPLDETKEDGQMSEEAMIRDAYQAGADWAFADQGCRGGEGKAETEDEVVNRLLAETKETGS